LSWVWRSASDQKFLLCRSRRFSNDLHAKSHCVTEPVVGHLMQ
jgi:hypothetical protein